MSSITTRQLFLQHVAQTSPLPLMLEVDRAEGVYIFDIQGKRYLDLNSGISVSSLGHCHPAVVKAIRQQAGKYMHTMVYGEHVQSPQVEFAQLLTSQLDRSLDNVYYLNGGSEAVEAAMKLSRRSTGRYNIIAGAGAYHGSTLGAESLRSDNTFTQAYVPGIPGIKHIRFNILEDLSKIDSSIAAVFIEPVQAESGIILPQSDYLIALRKRCTEVGALLVLDEIQTGFGRTGYLFAHQKYDIVPDMLLIGKSMGGGMPISGLVANKSLMEGLIKNPALGHITTFGGHPVPCAAAHAGLKALLEDRIIEGVLPKERLIRKHLKHPLIKEIRSSGMMMAVELTKRKYLKYVVSRAFELGALVDYFLFDDRSFRMAPPLVISEKELLGGIRIILEAIDYAGGRYE